MTKKAQLVNHDQGVSRWVLRHPELLLLQDLSLFAKPERLQWEELDDDLKKSDLTFVGT